VSDWLILLIVVCHAGGAWYVRKNHDEIAFRNYMVVASFVAAVIFLFFGIRAGLRGDFW